MRVDNSRAVAFNDTRFVVLDTAPPFLPDANPVALHTIDSNIHFYECRLTGGTGVSGHFGRPGEPGSTALRADGGFVFSSGTSFVGGSGGMGSLDDGNGCGNGGPGGPGVHLAGGAPTFALRQTVTSGGAGGVPGGAGCQGGGAGPGILVDSGVTLPLQGCARQLIVPRVLRGGQATSVRLQGIQGDSVQIVLSGRSNPTFLLSRSGTLLPARPVRALPPNRVQSPDGVLEIPAVVPNIPSGIGHLVFLQGAFFNPIEAVALSSGRAVLFVDGAVLR